MPCKYFDICPLRKFEKEGKLSGKWKNTFCATDKNWANCVRYQETKKGIPHSDNKLPDGKVYKDLNQ